MRFGRRLWVAFALFVAVVVIMAACVVLARGMGWSLPSRAIHGRLSFDSALNSAGAFRLGSFTMQWDPSSGGRMTVFPSDTPARALFSTKPGEAFVAAAHGRERVTESRGSFTVRDRREVVFQNQHITGIEQDGDSVRVSGRVSSGRRTAEYTLTFHPEAEHTLVFTLSVSAADDPPCNRALLAWTSDAQERFFGFGEQFTHFDLKGRRVPILVREQGIGRGLQPVTFLANLLAGSGGDALSSYASVPHFITSRLRSVALENHEYSVFDLREADRIQVEVFGGEIRGRILHGDSPEDLIQAYTAWAGRMRPLPDWIHRGAIVGMQGGTARVREIWRTLHGRGTPVAAFWLQDWEGQRVTSFGKQLWWNWELDRERYPEWEALRDELAEEGVRLMTYINPFLVDVEGQTSHKRNLYREALEKGFFVRTEEGEPYPIKNTDFAASLLDLTNPEACAWIKEVIKDQMIGTGASGWMADYGEALPFDTVLASGSTGGAFHNEYPEAWARVNREAIEEAGRGDDIVFFMRSGFSRSPRWATLFWEGDQMVTWDGFDGIKTAVTGLLSSGLSGYALNHSDIGGYTTISSPIRDYHRDKELLMRWMELNAFTAVYRTHEGNDPGANVQFYTDQDALSQFDRFAKVYAAWGFYRKELVAEAAETGLPVVRHLFVHYPEDARVHQIRYEEFLVGTELLVAPVLDPGVTQLHVYLPRGRWVHLWSGEEHGSADSGTYITVATPMRQPAVFYREGSAVGARIVQELRDAGVME